MRKKIASQKKGSLFLALRLLLYISVPVFVVLALKPDRTPPSIDSEGAIAIVQDQRIDENSGIAFSRRYPDCIWTHNDSGSKPHLYLVSVRTGHTLATLKIEEATNRDWEDIVCYRRADTNYIAIGDFGDNHKRRSDYQICILPEPDLDFPVDHSATDTEIVPISDWIDLQFTFDDGESRNTESIGYDCIDDCFILMQKIYPDETGPAGVFSLEIPEQSDTLQAEQLCEIKIKDLTAMDISRDGTQLAMRAYGLGAFIKRTPDETWTEAIAKGIPNTRMLPFQVQGEGICFYPKGDKVLLSSEEKKHPLHAVAVETSEKP